MSSFEHAAELHRRGQLREAEPLYEAVLRAHPRHFDAAQALGVLHLQQGRPDRAADRLGLAVRIDPKSAPTHRDYGIALLALGLSGEAIACFDTAVALDPGEPTAHYFRGNALHRAGRAGDALASYDTALALRPEYFEAVHNRANALRDLDRLEDAVRDYERAAALRPNQPLALYNLAFALQDLGRFDDALAHYNRAVGLKPDFHEARKARASLNLLLGRWDKGLPEFEHRLAAGDATLDPRLRAVRYWSGETLEGRSIVVYGDGAFGDLVQFGRYLPLLSERAAEVALLVPAPFRSMFAGALPNVRIAMDFDRADFRCEVMSLPFLLKAAPASVPAALSLAQDPDRIARWARRLDKTRFNVGICWQGNPARNIDRGRSVPLAAFAPLARVPGVRLVSLQKKHGLDQLEALPSGMAVETLGTDFDEGPDAFVDTAAAIASLDLVVTSDTALAHLAATLGCPTWIALRYVPEWRWFLERQDSPWYPVARLFRQTQPGQWGAVFDDIAEALASAAARRI